MSQEDGQLIDENLKPGELTQEQLALVNNLMYIKDISNKENKGLTLGEYLKTYKDNNYEKVKELPQGATETSTEDWKAIMDAVSNDDKLSDMKITSTLNDDKEAKAICISDDNYPDKATVVFRGTAPGEWLDNGTTGYTSDTPQQEEAKEWVDSLPSEYTDITASGHSKGGNKSEYVHILCDRVTRSVAFDEPGFGEEFYEKYKDQIEAKRDSAISICAQGDYVNILFNRVVGTRVYTQSDDSFIDRITDSKIGGRKAASISDMFPSYDMFHNVSAIIGTANNICDVVTFLTDKIDAGREHAATTFLSFENGIPKLRNEAEQDPSLKLLHDYIVYVDKYGKKEDKEYLFKLIMNQLQGEKYKTEVGNPPDGFEERMLSLSGKWLDNLNIPDSEKAKLTELLNDYLENGSLTQSEADTLNSIVQDIDKKMNTTTSIYTKSSIIRDFSEGARQKLLAEIKDVEGDNPLEYHRWQQWDEVDDCVRIMLFIEFFHNDINKYYEYLIEKNNESIKNIGNIFDVAYQLDNNHSSKLKEQVENFNELESDIMKLTQGLNTSTIKIDLSNLQVK